MNLNLSESWHHDYKRKKKYPMTLLKMVRQTLFRTTALSVGTTSMGFHSGGEREGSTANTARESGNL